VRIDPIGNDTPGQGQAFDEGSLRLCPVGSTPPACTSLVVPTPQGTWVVDPFTGGVVFTPIEGFKGKVEIPYVIETETGDEVDSVITVWITDPPAATDDASTGRVDTPQTLTPLGNDTADAAPWVPATLRLCGDGQVPAGCDATRVETADGVYVVDPVTGKVTFTPAPGFTGDATPIQYQVADEAGQVAHAWLRPRVAGGGGAQSGWLQVRKVITKGAELRTGQVKLVTVCTGDAGQAVKRTHVMDTGIDRDTWRVRVPAGMSCKVHERAHGAPTTPGMAPMWDSRRWQVGHTPSIDVGEKVPVGTATAIDRLILSAKGGCAIVAGELVGVAVGTCIVTWRAPGASVTTTTRWTHTTARATRTGEGTLTRAIPITGGATTRVTFTNAYDARAHVVTRTVYITDPCAPTPKIGPRYAGTNPGTCS
jgi:CshA-type fibril repeat protein